MKLLCYSHDCKPTCQLFAVKPPYNHLLQLALDDHFGEQLWRGSLLPAPQRFGNLFFGEIDAVKQVLQLTGIVPEQPENMRLYLAEKLIVGIVGVARELYLDPFDTEILNDLPCGFVQQLEAIKMIGDIGEFQWN